MTRWHIRCDACEVAAWIGAGSGRLDAWCEGCQTPATLAAGAESAACPHCGLALTVGSPRFEELYGAVQELGAVLAAWSGNPGPLGRILPERPRYLTDLTPPELASDDAHSLSEALERLAHGAFTAARAGLEVLLAERGPIARDPRAWLGLGIAAQRLGELALAEAAFTRVLELDPTHAVARLDRGALRARRGDFAEAREDLALAGDGHEARWNRAAVHVLEAVATTAGMPAAAAIERARSEAGAPSDYWSDPTVGRLLLSALIERARARMVASGAACADARVLRAAERELEFDTFWDRALLLHGLASLALAEDAAEVAAALAGAQLASLLAEPAVAGAAGAFLAPALRAAGWHVAAGDPASALAAVTPLIGRQDLAGYRVPCLACARGAIGVDALDDDEPVVG